MLRKSDEQNYRQVGGLFSLTNHCTPSQRHYSPTPVSGAVLYIFSLFRSILTSTSRAFPAGGLFWACKFSAMVNASRRNSQADGDNTVIKVTLQHWVLCWRLCTMHPPTTPLVISSAARLPRLQLVSNWPLVQIDSLARNNGRASASTGRTYRTLNAEMQPWLEDMDRVWWELRTDTAFFRSESSLLVRMKNCQWSLDLYRNCSRYSACSRRLSGWVRELESYIVLEWMSHPHY